MHTSVHQRISKLLSIPVANQLDMQISHKLGMKAARLADKVKAATPRQASLEFTGRGSTSDLTQFHSCGSGILRI